VKNRIFVRPLASLAVALAAVATLNGCAALFVGGAVVGGGLVALDRRTSGAQLEDQAIELKGSARVRELATLGHINISSYNRMALVTGEVPTEDDRSRVEESLSRMDNVRSIVNELAVAPNSSIGTRSSDTILSGKVKATFVDAKDLQANALKVVTERGIVYLMGRVTEREASRAADVAASVPGVQKVIRVFEVISEDELAGLVKPGSSAK